MDGLRLKLKTGEGDPPFLRRGLDFSAFVNNWMIIVNDYRAVSFLAQTRFIYKKPRFFVNNLRQL